MKTTFYYIDILNFFFFFFFIYLFFFLSVGKVTAQPCGKIYVYTPTVQGLKVRPFHGSFESYSTCYGGRIQLHPHSCNDHLVNTLVVLFKRHSVVSVEGMLDGQEFIVKPHMF